MKLAQSESGEIDCAFYNQRSNLGGEDMNRFIDGYRAINYTQAVSVLNKNNVEHYLSPRYQICPFEGGGGNLFDSQGTELAKNGTMCLKFIDTEQEKAISLGVSWPYEKLGPNECLLSSVFAAQGVKIGDKVIMSIYEEAYWVVLIAQYNHAALANDWPTIDAS